jgi:hypothetical protein
MGRDAPRVDRRPHRGGPVQPVDQHVALSSLPAKHSGLAAGVNDACRQAGIAVGIAALGALIPAGAATGHGDPQAYVTGRHHALLAGAALAAGGAVAVARLLGPARASVGVPPVAADGARA